MRKNHFIGSVALIALAALFAPALGRGKTTDENTPQPNPQPKSNPNPNPGPQQGPQPDKQPKRAALGEPKYRVTNKQLLQESKGELKSLKKYEGAVIEVSGTAAQHAYFNFPPHAAPSVLVARYDASLILGQAAGPAVVLAGPAACSLDSIHLFTKYVNGIFRPAKRSESRPLRFSPGVWG